MRHEDWRTVEFFVRDEFSNPEKMWEPLIRRLDMIRRDVGMPMYVTSSYRPGDAKAHGKGFAVDVSDNQGGEDVSSRWRMYVVSAALENGIRRIGVYNKHVHLDLWGDAPQDVMWWAESS